MKGTGTAGLISYLVLVFSFGLLSTYTSAHANGRSTASAGELRVLWSTSIPGATCVDTWDYDGDGIDEIFVNARNSLLKVYGLDGTIKAQISFPFKPQFEIGHHPTGSFHILAYSIWDYSVTVWDSSGTYLWFFPTPYGVDGAHWGDLNGDGRDEMVVGLNGVYGLHILSDSGQALWSDMTIANVWSQAIVPATDGNAGLVFATEAAGTIRMYTAGGGFVRSFRPLNQYCTYVNATRISSTGEIQVVTFAGDSAVAFDTTGQTMWISHGWDRPGTWPDEFEKGDLDGDGVIDWVYRPDSNSLSIRSADDGTQLALYEDGGRFVDYDIARCSKSPGALVALVNDSLIVFEYSPFPRCGDADGEGTINIADAVYLISYIFSHGPAPSPLAAGDADCSGDINIADCVYLINYIFSHGPQPCAGCK